MVLTITLSEKDVMHGDRAMQLASLKIAEHRAKQRESMLGKTVQLKNNFRGTVVHVENEHITLRNKDTGETSVVRVTEDRLNQLCKPIEPRTTTTPR